MWNKMITAIRLWWRMRKNKKADPFIYK